METTKTTNYSPNTRQEQYKELYLKYIISEIEKGTGQSISELKRTNTQKRVFYISLKHITTTKKAICKALNLDLDAMCRYKRKLEKQGLLVQSNKDVVCKYTNHYARLLTTNPLKFDELNNLVDG